MNARHAVSAVLAAALFTGLASPAAAQADNTNSVIAPANDFTGNTPDNWRTYPFGMTRDEYYGNSYRWNSTAQAPQGYY